MSERVVLSFLGLGPKEGYSETTYVFEDRAVETDLMPHAVDEVMGPDTLIVAGTEASNQKYRDKLHSRIEFTSVTVPEGEGEEEWWEIFEVITEVVPEEAQLTIDITHGFRSLPVIALAVALYLDAVRNVTVDRIIYGAFRPNRDESPILNLASFLDLIEWTVAARQFLRDGSARGLAALMEEIQNTAHRSQADIKPRNASSAAAQLKGLTQALSVVRPEEVSEERIADLQKALQAVREDAERVPKLRPLTVLLDRIQERIDPMQTTTLFGEEGFAAQAEMMRFYLKTEQLQQAITLAREAMISYQALEMGLNPEPVSKEEWEGCGRDQAAEALGSLANQRDYQSEREKKLGDLWSMLSEVRNDINHAGMNVEPEDGPTLSGHVEEVVGRVASYITSKTGSAQRG